MASVEVTVNGHGYAIACNDGEEAQITALAAQVEAKLQDVVSMVGQIGDQRLLLMSAILLADDLGVAQGKVTAAREDAENLKNQIRTLENQLDNAEALAADKLEAAARRVEMVLGTLPAPEQQVLRQEMHTDLSADLRDEETLSSD